MLCLQTARYLLKALALARSGKPVAGSASYLTEAAPGAVPRAGRCAGCGVRTEDDWANPSAQVAALRHRALSRCEAAGAALATACPPGGQLVFEGAPWNACTVELIRAAKAHCLYVLHSTFVSALGEAEARRELSGAAVAALRRLAVLHGLSLLEKDLGEFMEDGYVDGERGAWWVAVVECGGAGWG